MENDHLAVLLLDWYDKEGRTLPWRTDPSPYHVWISEIMLQQTRVEAVKGYYERFLRALPDIASLAEAPEDLYLKLWEGLGYYSRVRNLHKAACVIMEEHGGRMPETAAELRKLPGIGPYTSAAIASIAFGERIPAIDGNLLRVFARMTAWQENIKTPASASRAGDYFSSIMPADRPGDFNQALMDLGAMICLPGGLPRCEECPWAEACVARQQGIEKELPKMPPKAAKKIEDKTVFLIRSGSRIMIRKRPARGLLAGMYEFPSAAGHLDEKEAAAWLRSMGIEAVRIRKLPEARHVFTHKEWHMTGYEVMADELSARIPGKGIFPAETEAIRLQYPVPSAYAVYKEAAGIGR